ncbi:MAG: protocatechuate 3,4-dioxygenase [Kofleriaceae bacterium]|nr:protocatechuate 3,4-dioxygenase [Kofleriaceae bacterium]
MRNVKPRHLDRRQLLRAIGFGIAATPFVIGACTDAAAEMVDANGSGSGSSDGSLPSDWANGGTVSMTDKASYPDPFAAATTTCAIVAGVTEGPCTTTTTLDREDISEGWTGLPVRLALKIVDASCAPIAGAVVKIWATNNAGSYSGQTPNNGMCLKDQSYSSMNFMRGARTTNADGVVYFDTCFPGWYRGRAVHIHFQVSSGNTTYKVSQLFFPEDLTASIFSDHVDYKSFGQPDTTFANDNVMSTIPSASRAQNIVEYARMTDGAMLASKVVTVKS